jgi:hypothetical protein
MGQVWISPVDGCDLCDALFGESEPMYDCNVGGAGQWGNICRSCFQRTCSELGQGKGQQYELQWQGRRKAWVKVAG